MVSRTTICYNLFMNLSDRQLYFFELGRDQDCAVAELASSLPAEARLIDWAGQFVVVAATSAIDSAQLQQKLGGIVRIGRVTTSVPHLNFDDLRGAVLDELRSRPTHNFGISLVGFAWKPNERNRLGLEIKKLLRADKQSVRFVVADKLVVQSVVAHDQLITKGVEFVAIQGRDSVYLGTTEAVQNWREWSYFDFDRPIRDPRRGMLPPKLARLMLNLSGAVATDTLLDPFCGIGTTLQEAIRSGHTRVVGTDTDPRAIAAADKNLSWLLSGLQPQSEPQVTLEVADLKHLPINRLPAIDIIVTEGALGASTLNRMQLYQRVDEMTKVFRAYQDWLGQLRLIHARVVVLAFPLLREPRTEFPIAKAVAAAGWKLVSFTSNPSWLHHPAWVKSSVPILTYERPDQVVGRQIVKLVPIGTSHR